MSRGRVGGQRRAHLRRRLCRPPTQVPRRRGGAGVRPSQIAAEDAMFAVHIHTSSSSCHGVRSHLRPRHVARFVLRPRRDAASGGWQHRALIQKMLAQLARRESGADATQACPPHVAPPGRRFRHARHGVGVAANSRRRRRWRRGGGARRWAVARPRRRERLADARCERAMVAPLRARLGVRRRRRGAQHALGQLLQAQARCDGRPTTRFWEETTI